MIIAAIDPGLTGACAVLDHNGLRAVFDLPTMPDPTAGPEALVKRKIDGRALVKLLRQHCPPGEKVRAVIERIGTTGPQNNHAIQTQGSLLRSLGALENTLEILGWGPAYAHPQTWKRHFGLIGKGDKLTDAQRKRKSLECARRLYPDCSEIARASDHNRSEAILIAHYFRQVNA